MQRKERVSENRQRKACFQFVCRAGVLYAKDTKETSTPSKPPPIWGGCNWFRADTALHQGFGMAHLPLPLRGEPFFSFGSRQYLCSRATAQPIFNSQFSIFNLAKPFAKGVNCSKRGENLKNPLKSLLSCFVGSTRVRIFASRISKWSCKEYSREGRKI